MFPSAFSSEEELVKTILNEKCHVLQLKKHGKAYAQQNLDLMEKQAYRFERLFYSLVTKRWKYEMAWQSSEYKAAP